MIFMYYFCILSHRSNIYIAEMKFNFIVYYNSGKIIINVVNYYFVKTIYNICMECSLSQIQVGSPYKITINLNLMV